MSPPALKTTRFEARAYSLDSCWQEDAEFQRVFVRLVEGLNLYYKKDR